MSLVTQGFQYLTETRFDQVDPVLNILRKGIEALGLPLRSLEIELGPSQCEFTFGTETGLAVRRHDDPVPLGDEADRAPARLSRQLHVPAGFAEHVFLRLASASVPD